MNRQSSIEQFFTNRAVDRAVRQADSHDHFTLLGRLDGGLLRYSKPEFNRVACVAGAAVLSHLSESGSHGEIYVIGGDLSGSGYEETAPFVRVMDRAGEPTSAERKELVRGEEHKIFMTNTPHPDGQAE